MTERKAGLESVRADLSVTESVRADLSVTESVRAGPEFD